LKLLADWCKQAGLKLIQILPINDRLPLILDRFVSPYAAISAFALHPLYLNLRQVVSNNNKRLLKELEDERKRLNSLEAVDYEAVLNTKLDFLDRIYGSQKGPTLIAKTIKKFFEQNRHWLVPYAAFSCLRDKYGTADFASMASPSSLRWRTQ